jgi:lysophospholipase L1-like esterase
MLPLGDVAHGEDPGVLTGVPPHGAFAAIDDRVGIAVHEIRMLVEPIENVGTVHRGGLLAPCRAEGDGRAITAAVERLQTPSADDFWDNTTLMKKALFVLVIAIANLLLLECGARVIFAFKLGPRILLYGTRYHRTEQAEPTARTTGADVDTEFGGYSKYAPHEYKAEVDHETGEFFRVAINQHGFRGEEFSLEKAPGSIRIVTLGASSTFGFFDRDDETYPFYLERDLTEKGGGAAFEVINLGIPHQTSKQILALFRAEALPLRPDVVTFYEGRNDASLMPDEVWKQKRDAPPETAAGRLRSAVSHLAILRTLYNAAREHLLTVNLADSFLTGGGVFTYTREDFEKHVQGEAEEFIANLSAIRDACQRSGILFIVMTQQVQSHIVADIKGLTYQEEVALARDKLERSNAITHEEKSLLAHALLMEALTDWARSRQVPLLDVISLLDHDRDVLLSHVHLSPKGNRMIADALSEEILRELRAAGRL